MTNKGSANNTDAAKLPFRMAIVGGGRACKFFLSLLGNESFDLFDLKIVGVCDIDPEAEGFLLAKEMGIYTTNDFQDLFEIKDLDGVIELTGNREVLLDLIRHRPKGMGVLEHNIGRVLRRLYMTDQRLKSVEQEVAVEKGASDFLIRQTNERIVVLNPDFTIGEANESFLTAVGKSKEAVIGARCYEITHELSAPCLNTQPELGCPLVETMRTGESAHVIHEHPTPGDHPTYCDMVTYPLKDETGEIVRVIEIWRDITEELSSRWERRVKEMRADLKKLIQEDRLVSLGKLAASSVHEINNPIQGLLTFSHLMEDILKKGQPDPEDLEEFRGYLSLMSEELERCGDIVSSLLSFSRESTVEYQDIDLNEILRQVIALTRHKMELQDIRLVTELSPKPLSVNGDANHLQQCFLNLIFNSIEAMPQGGQLNVKAEIDDSRKCATVRVEDTGCGISEEHLDHIFDPFFTTKEAGEGTGMGLSIVYGIVKSHGGNIELESSTENGTSFVLSFPAL